MSKTNKLIRCKMKCMGIADRHNKVVVEFQAVTPHSTEPENATFYKYTPSAQLTMEYPKGEIPAWIQAGQSYYLDMTKCEVAEYPIDWSNPALWILSWGIQLNGPESREYPFRRCAYERKNRTGGQGVPPYNGEFRVSVDNPATFDTFGVEGDVLWLFSWTPAVNDYAIYVNGEHHHLLGEPDYDTVVKLAGVEGDIEVLKGSWDGKPEEGTQMTRGGFVFNPSDDVVNCYVVRPIG